MNKVNDIVSREEFMGLLKVSVPDLEKLHKVKSKLKGKPAEDDFKVRLGALIVSTPKEMQIRKIKI